MSFYILIPRTCESVRLYDRGEFRWQMELRLLNQLTLRWGDDPELSKSAPCDQQGFLRVKEGSRRKKHRDGHARTWPEDAAFEGEGIWSPAKEWGWPLEVWKRQRNALCPRGEPRKELSPTDILISTHETSRTLG